jgi:hypothetical protein
MSRVAHHSRPWLYAVAVALVMTVLGRPASAELIFRLTDVESGTVVLCADQSDCDLNPTVGVVTMVGSIGRFDVDFTTGYSKPVIGGGDVAEMDVRSLNVILRDGGGTLIIEASDTDFDLGTASTTLVSTLSGTMRSATGSSVRGQQCVSLTNVTQFETRDALTELKNCDGLLSHGPLVQTSSRPLPFADQKSTSVSLTGNFSIAERIILGFSGNGNAIFDFDSALGQTRAKPIPRRR